MTANETNMYELLYYYHLQDEFACREILRIAQNLIHIEVKLMIRRFNCYRMYFDDLCQECTLSVLDALDHFREEDGAHFIAYCRVAIHRRINAFTASMNTKKAVPYHETVSIDELEYDCLESQDSLSDPVYVLYYHEAVRAVQDCYTNCMSASQREFMDLCAGSIDYGYSEEYEKLGMSKRSYDGRKKRLKEKLRNHLR